MKVLFIGGTGVISEACTWLAAERGIEVYLFNRGTTQVPIPAGVKVINGDIHDVKSSARTLKGMRFDCVVDWIAYEPEQVEADMKLFSGKTAQYIFISTASVYQTPPTHYVVTEGTPAANPIWKYSQHKIECEQRLMKAYRGKGFPVTIVRPSSTYSYRKMPGLIGCGGWSLIKRMMDSKKVIVHGDGTSLWTFTHNKDFAKGFVGLLGNIHAIGHTFHITSDEVLTWNQICQTMGAAVGVMPDIIHIPTDFINAMYPEIGEGFLGERSHSRVYDNSKIKSFVPGYVATIPFSEGVKECVSWFRANPDQQVVNVEAEKKVDRIIAAYDRAFGKFTKT